MNAKEKKRRQGSLRIDPRGTVVPQTTRRLLLYTGVILLTGLGLFLFFSPRSLNANTPVCDGRGMCYILHTTTDDFVKGHFYATGLRRSEDGEVQLIPMGLTSPWQQSTDLPEARAELAAVAYNNILYAIGGQDSQGSARSEIYSATTTLTGDITAAGWQIADYLPRPRAGATAVISPTSTSAVLYVIGGGEGSGGTGTIWYKVLGNGGSLQSSSWQTATLPIPLTNLTAVVNAGYLYVIGGSDNQNIYRFSILNENGNLSRAQTETHALPRALDNLTAVVWQGLTSNWLYVLGGATSSQAYNDVYYTQFNQDGSLNAWQTTTLVDAISAHGTVQANSNIYVIGGKKGIYVNEAISQVHTALIDLSPVEGELHDWGSVGKWIVTTPLPQARFSHGTVINHQNGEAYVLGGFNEQGIAQSTVFRGPTTGAGATYAPTGQYISSIINRNSNRAITDIQVSATLTPTEGIALTIQYRAANSEAELLAKTWTTLGDMDRNTPITGITKTFHIATTNDRTSSLIQYRALFTTTIPSVSPLLNFVRINYYDEDDSTDIDLTITGIGTPNANTTPITQTIIVRVKNSGNQNFNNPSARPLARPGALPSPPFRPKPGNLLPLRVPRAPSGISYYVWVDVYIDPSSPPLQAYPAGNCKDYSGDQKPGLQYIALYNLGRGQSVDLTFQCYVTTTGNHTYYAQVDTCWDPQGLDCSHEYGLVRETNENNNIFGPVYSGTSLGPTLTPTPGSGNSFLPLILK